MYVFIRYDTGVGQNFEFYNLGGVYADELRPLA